MKDKLHFSRLAYPRATLITCVGLSLLVLSVAIFANVQSEPFAASQILSNASLLKLLTSTFG